MEEVILERVVSDVDPDVKVNVCLRLHEKYLREAEKLYAEGNLAQASEKYWGAVTALINAIGEARGWRHYTYRDCAEVVERLSEELGEPLGRLFASAERLHANYYHSFLTRMSFEARREDALKLIRRLKVVARDWSPAGQSRRRL